MLENTVSDYKWPPKIAQISFTVNLFSCHFRKCRPSCAIVQNRFYLIAICSNIFQLDFDVVTKVLCLDCQHSVKFAHKVRQQVLDVFGVEAASVANTVEVYEIINDGLAFKCIETQAAEDGQETGDMIEIHEVDENFELNEGADELADEYVVGGELLERQSRTLNSADSASGADDTQDPLDAVSFLLEKRELFDDDDDSPNRNAGRRTHKCDVCEKSFMRKSNLVDHLRLHANLRLFKCEYCSKEFVQAGNYRSHLRVSGFFGNFEFFGHFVQFFAFLCNFWHFLCNLWHFLHILIIFCQIFGIFIQFLGFFVEIAHFPKLPIFRSKIHTKERPYACSMCPKTYNQSSALKVHIRSHTNEKNYVCETCNKAFTNSSDLNKHKRVHDPDSKYKCKDCDKTFAQRVNLKNHIERHHQGESRKGRKKKSAK